MYDCRTDTSIIYIAFRQQKLLLLTFAWYGFARLIILLYFVVMVQIPRQMHPQMQQMVHPQNLAFQQQQLERMRRRQPSTPRPVMDVDKDRPMVQVKIENPSELPMDGNAFNAIHSRHPQMQFRQQQIAAMSNLHAQSSNQLRQLASMQVPQMQTP